MMKIAARFTVMASTAVLIGLATEAMWGLVAIAVLLTIDTWVLELSK